MPVWFIIFKKIEKKSLKTIPFLNFLKLTQKFSLTNNLPLKDFILKIHLKIQEFSYQALINLVKIQYHFYSYDVMNRKNYEQLGLITNK